MPRLAHPWGSAPTPSVDTAEMTELNNRASTVLPAPLERFLSEFQGVKTALGLVAIIGPLVGLPVRMVSFVVDGTVPDPVFMASAASIPTLILTGISAIPTALISTGLAILIGAYARYSLNYGGKPLEMDRTFRLQMVVIWTLFFLAVPVFVFQVPDPFVGGVLSVVAAVAYGFWPEQGGQLGRVVTTVALVYAGTILSVGLGQDRPAHDYRFDPSTGLASGLAVELGRSEGTLYVQLCAGRSVVGIPTGAAVVYLRPPHFPPRLRVWEPALTEPTLNVPQLKPRSGCDYE